MQFFQIYRNNFNDLVIAVENFDASLSDEFYALKSINTERIITYQIQKFEITFQMLIKQMKLFFERLHIKIPQSSASVIRTFFDSSNLNETSYEILLEMNIAHKKMNLASEQKKSSFNEKLYKKLDNYYTTMLLSLKYLDYDDAHLFEEIQ